jgi:hypothetical protein
MERPPEHLVDAAGKRLLRSRLEPSGWMLNETGSRGRTAAEEEGRARLGRPAGCLDIQRKEAAGGGGRSSPRHPSRSPGEHLKATLEKHKVPKAEIDEIMAIAASTAPDIIEKK